ncbi:MAG: FtsX-like permease family protein [Blastocatellales bacterium]
MQSIDSDLPILETSTIAERFEKEHAGTRLQAVLLGLFAVLAFVLAAAGLYGTISYSVSRRTQELGIRLALGASSQQITRLIVGEGLSLVLGGVLVGLALAFLLTKPPEVNQMEKNDEKISVPGAVSILCCADCDEPANLH